MPRRPNTPCAGGCGTLLWDSNTSLPAGRRMCQPCRRAGKRTSCIKGHQLTPDNTFVNPRTLEAQVPDHLLRQMLNPAIDPSRILERSNVRAAHLACNARRTDFQFGKAMLVE